MIGFGSRTLMNPIDRAASHEYSAIEFGRPLVSLLTPPSLLKIGDVITM